MSQNFGIVLSEDELGSLIAKYSKRGDVDYRSFADEISSVFTEKNLERSPRKVRLLARCLLLCDLQPNLRA